jgi:ribosomal protein S18 acetylase RimI-like enzyme
MAGGRLPPPRPNRHSVRVTAQPFDHARAYKLDASHAGEAAALLTRAFFDYPMWAWVLPDEKHRRRALPLAMRASVAWGLILDNAFGIGEPLCGVAIWAPPGMADIDVDPDGSRTNWAAVEDAVGPDGLRRFERMVEVQKPFRDRHIAPGGWYLPWLGVDPAAQRTGAGSALLRAMWARLDPAGAATYLETENEANVAYYEKQGYELVHRGVLPDGGPPFFCFSRSPAR